MAEDTTQENTLPDAREERRFRVKLIQTTEVVTEQFTDLDGEPLTGNKKQALQKVQNFIDDHKELEEGSYRLEVEEIEPPQQPEERLRSEDDASVPPEQ